MGETGIIKYRNSWERKRSDQQKSSSKLRMANLAALEIYDYERYAPLIRQFTLGYAHLKKGLISDFLPLFYSEYLYQYYYSNRQLVQDTIFKMGSFSAEEADAIYKDENYGIGKPEALKQWIIAASQGD